MFQIVSVNLKCTGYGHAPQIESPDMFHMVLLQEIRN